jgi:glutaredoxin
MRFISFWTAICPLLAPFYAVPILESESITAVPEAQVSTHEAFKTKIGQGYHFVMFHSQDCPHCVDLKPVFEDYMAGKVDMEKIIPGGAKNLAFDEVDCKTHLDLCLREGLTAVPALRLYPSAALTYMDF